MASYARQLPAHCTAFSSDAGKALFKQAMNLGHMECFFKLAAQLRSHDQVQSSGTAVLATVLNALQVDSRLDCRPSCSWYREELLDNCIPLGEIAEKGLTYDYFAMLAVCNNLDLCLRVRPNNCEEEKAAFRNLVLEVTRRDNHVLVLSYSRAAVGQAGVGHFAPVGGFNPTADQVLVFDLARSKYPSHWVSLDLLWEAMTVSDSLTGLPRGYFLLKKTKVGSYLTFQIDRHLLDALFPPTGTNTEVTRAVRSWWASWMAWLEAPETQLAVLHAALDELLQESTAHLFFSSKLFFVVIRARCFRGNNITRSLFQGLEATPAGRTVRAALKERRKAGPWSGNCEGCARVGDVLDPCAANLIAFLLAFPYRAVEGTWDRALWLVQKAELTQVNGVAKAELHHLNEILKVLVSYWQGGNSREVSM